MLVFFVFFYNIQNPALPSTSRDLEVKPKFDEEQNGLDEEEDDDDDEGDLSKYDLSGWGEESNEKTEEKEVETKPAPSTSNDKGNHKVTTSSRSRRDTKYDP